jgi:ATP-dependent protease ClpP protease subunit
MRRPEVCKHQVCDHCGRRFGMVTHRWWGNKFCKRACKNAHRRENHHTQSGWVIPRSFTFAGGGACLAAAVAVAVVTLLLLASANAAPSEEQSAAGISLEFNREDGALYIDLSGPIVAGTADDVRAALGMHDTTLNRVVLFLDSAGGKVDDGDRVIEVLNEIKLRHELITVVPHGKLCASMCIPIFLQGEDRLAARASIWLFHEAAQRRANGVLRTDTAETGRLFRKYYAPAGVSMHWLKSIAPMIKEADLWQTGGDLISAKSGIILHPLGDRTVRDVTAPPVDADRGRDLPLGKKTAADAVGNAPIRSE